MKFLSAVCLLLSSTIAEALNTTSTDAKVQLLPNNFTPPQYFKNNNLVRIINLEKNYVRESINIALENISKSPQSKYYVSFPTQLIGKVGGLEAWQKDATIRHKFEVTPTQLLPSSSNQFYIVNLPTPLQPSSRYTITLSYYILSSLTPLPAAIAQDAQQYLTYSFPQYTLSAYTTGSQKTIIKFANADIPDYTRFSASDPDQQGSTFTYGPYASREGLRASEPITVRYEFTKAITVCSKLERDLEVSHWGGNLATEDRYWLRNDGAGLSTEFSRVGWSLKQYQKQPSRAISVLRVPLAPGTLNPYYTDDIGNVSTSRYQPGSSTRPSLLDLRPRYPVFGGWKYSFRIGWNNALSGYLRKQEGSSEGYVLKVPFLEGPRMPEGVQYEDVVVRVILPEGAVNVKYQIGEGVGLPNVIRSGVSLHKTFMDTKGRTVLTLTTHNVADEARDSQLIVTYDYPFTALFRKPITIFATIFGVLVTVWVVGNIDVKPEMRATPVLRAAQSASNHVVPVSKKYTLQSYGIWERFRRIFAVDPERSNGVPINALFRNPPSGALAPQSYTDPVTLPAGDIADNPYWKRDMRRNYPQPSTLKQADVVGLLTVGSQAAPKDTLLIGEAGTKQLAELKETAGAGGLATYFETSQTQGEVLGSDGLPPLPANLNAGTGYNIPGDQSYPSNDSEFKDFILTDLPPQSLVSESLVPPREIACPTTSTVSLDGLLDPPLQLREDLKEGCGGQIWPAGVLLAKYMIEHHASINLIGKTIIELGSGSGLVGLAVARGCTIDSSIYVTDQIPMLPLMQQNIALNSMTDSVHAAVLDWGDMPALQTLPKAQVILAADCVYFEPAFPLLIQTLDGLLDTEDSVCYFCFKRRRKADIRFFKQARKLFDVVEVTEGFDREHCRKERIFLYIIKKRIEKKKSV
ncbi:dolichyl-diphosphooligosaccharide--protein glycosyltransferase subunit 1 [Myotisia sp. PD_48]|nr:dolichyl-diphosphooligosaccharide--protein glycosyltransferase subunit 1 [Myotisia sp. PD_48]